MKIEVLCIGNELLSGKTANTNALTISKRLFDQGYRVHAHRVVKDSLNEINKTFQETFLDPTLLICAGGLGPTIDDLTKEAIAAFFDVELELNPVVLNDLKERFGDLSTLENQATLIKGAILLYNPLGTANGMIYQFDRGTAIFLPGVPEELDAMLDDVLHYIGSAYPLSHVPVVRNLNLCLTEEPEIDPIIRKIQAEHKKVEFGIYPNLGGVQLQFIADNEKKILPILEEIIQKFPNKFYFSKTNRIEDAVHHLLLNEKYTLSFAESCTGGALAASLTKQAGCSKYFLGSIISYSNEMKKNLLHVSQITLDAEGAVSKATVQEMLEGLFLETEADYAIAISGIAGPTGGEKDKPIGTVFIGIAKRGEAFDIGRILAKGNRETIIEYTVNTALAMLYRKIKHKIRVFDE